MREFKPWAPFLLIVMLCGCSGSGEVSSTPPGPEQTMQQFIDRLTARDVDGALALMADIPLAERMDTKQRMTRMADALASAQAAVTIVKSRSFDDYAVVITDESRKDGRASFDLDPVYLVRRDGRWLVSGELTHRPSAWSADPEAAVPLEELSEWFEQQKRIIEEQRRTSDPSAGVQP